jgi:hypothetical protein
MRMNKKGQKLGFVATPLTSTIRFQITWTLGSVGKVRIRGIVTEPLSLQDVEDGSIGISTSPFYFRGNKFLFIWVCSRVLLEAPLALK